MLVIMLFMDPIAGGGDMGGGGRTWNGLEGSTPEGCRCPYMFADGLKFEDGWGTVWDRVCGWGGGDAAVGLVVRCLVGGCGGADEAGAGGRGLTGRRAGGG